MGVFACNFVLAREWITNRAACWGNVSERSVLSLMVKKAKHKNIWEVIYFHERTNYPRGVCHVGFPGQFFAFPLSSYLSKKRRFQRWTSHLHHGVVYLYVDSHFLFFLKKINILGQNYKINPKSPPHTCLICTFYPWLSKISPHFSRPTNTYRNFEAAASSYDTSKQKQNVGHLTKKVKKKNSLGMLRGTICRSLFWNHTASHFKWNWTNITFQGIRISSPIIYAKFEILPFKKNVYIEKTQPVKFRESCPHPVFNFL